MKLNFAQIQSITTGAVKIFETEEGVEFDRFTSGQREAFRSYAESFYLKTFSCGGMCLRFRTDSRKLNLRVITYGAGARSYFSFDVSVNGTVVGSLDNFSHQSLQEFCVDQTYPRGVAEKEFFLGAGEKKVQIYFPWTSRVVLQELSLEDGATLIPEIPQKTLLAFGDSITLGFDAQRPSNRYVGRLADALGAAEYNKAIGASVFIPEVTAEKEELKPDYITVAYGTNDWSTRTKEEFEKNCLTFFENLVRNYPGVPIYAFTPIWRADNQASRPMGAFAKVEEYIFKIGEQFPDVKVISGKDFVPHDTAMYADIRLHPNDAGFAHYFKNLWAALGEI